MNPAAINLAGSVIVPFATNRSKTTSAPQASDFLSRVSHASAAAAISQNTITKLNRVGKP